MSAFAQVYCTLDQVVADLNLNGDEPGLFSRIQAASMYIYRQFGNFIPMTDARRYGALLGGDLHVDPLLAVTSITNNGTPVINYDLLPFNRHWGNGPYTRIYQDGAWHEDDNQVIGWWGLYEEILDLGFKGTLTTAATSSLTVANGSLLSPGMVLLLGSEQVLVTGTGTLTPATSKLNGAIAASDEEIVVDNGAEFFVGEVLRIDTEDCCIRLKNTNLLVVARGWNGTTKAAHIDDSTISVYRTYSVSRGVNGTTAAAQSAVNVYWYLPPWDVNYLARQIAGLMRMKAAGGFAGKTGNAELGEVFYHNEFPEQVQKIKQNYRITRI